MSRAPVSITALNQFTLDVAKRITEVMLIELKALVKGLSGFEAAYLEKIKTPLEFLHRLQETGWITDNNNIVAFQVLAWRSNNKELFNEILNLVDDNFIYIGEPVTDIDQGEGNTKLSLEGKCAPSDFELVQLAAQYWLYRGVQSIQLRTKDGEWRTIRHADYPNFLSEDRGKQITTFPLKGAYATSDCELKLAAQHRPYDIQSIPLQTTEGKWLPFQPADDSNFTSEDVPQAATSMEKITGLSPIAKIEISKPKLKFINTEGKALHINQEGSLVEYDETKDLNGRVWTDGKFSSGLVYWEIDFSFYPSPDRTCYFDTGVLPREGEWLYREYWWLKLEYRDDKFRWQSSDGDISSEYAVSLPYQIPHKFRLGFYMETNNAYNSFAVLDCGAKKIIVQHKFRRSSYKLVTPFVYFNLVKSASIRIIPPEHTIPCDILHDILQPQTCQKCKRQTCKRQRLDGSCQFSCI